MVFDDNLEDDMETYHSNQHLHGDPTYCETQQVDMTRDNNRQVDMYEHANQQDGITYQTNQQVNNMTHCDDQQVDTSRGDNYHANMLLHGNQNDGIAYNSNVDMNIKQPEHTVTSGAKTKSRPNPVKSDEFIWHDDAVYYFISQC